MIEITIPQRIKRKSHTHINKYYHYKLVKVYQNHAVYRCEETGTLESFSKNDFVTRVEIEEKNIISENNNRSRIY